MARTNAIYGLAGVGFIDAQADVAIGYSLTATSLKITGGFELKSQMNSAGVTVEVFEQVAESTVEIEGITDATIGLVSRLRGGTLRTGSDTLPSVGRPGPVLPSKWAATTIAAAASMVPAPGAYTIEKTGVNTVAVRRLFTADAQNDAGGGMGEDVSAEFAVTTVPAGVDMGDVGYFFWEPAATGEVGEYIYGSINLPGEIAIVGVTEGNKAVGADNRNQARIRIPRVALQPIEVTHQAAEVAVLGTVAGILKHDAGLGGTHSIAHSMVTT